MLSSSFITTYLLLILPDHRDHINNGFSNQAIAALVSPGRDKITGFDRVSGGDFQHLLDFFISLRRLVGPFEGSVFVDMSGSGDDNFDHRGMAQVGAWDAVRYLDKQA